MSYYGTMLPLYGRFIRDAESRIDDPHAYGYDDKDIKNLRPFWDAEIVRFTFETGDLIKEAQQKMKNRPLWKKLLRKV